MSRKKHHTALWFVVAIIAVGVVYWVVQGDVLSININDVEDDTATESDGTAALDSERTTSAEDDTTPATKQVAADTKESVEEVADLIGDEETTEEVIAGDSGFTYRFNGPTDTITVTTAADANTILNAAMTITTEEEIEIDGYTARDITGRSQKDGATVHYLVIEKTDDVILVRGEDEFINRVIEEIEL